jgi:glycosyltransferase involved in cell wall biosynthesis
MNSNLLALLSTLQAQNGPLSPEILKNVETQMMQIQSAQPAQPPLPPSNIISLDKLQGSRKKKVLLVGTHIQQFTGYSKVTYNIVKYLAKKPDVELYHYGFQRARTSIPDYRPYPSNVNSFDAAAMEQPFEQGFGYKRLPEVIKQVQPDVLIIYNDSLVVCKFLEEIIKQLNADERRRFKIIIYLDQVYVGQRQMFMEMIRREASVVFAFTDRWRAVLEKQFMGDAPKPRLRTLRHGYSNDLFSEVDRSKVRAGLGIPTNGFLMLNVNRNSPRKRYDLLIMAFVELITKYPTKPIFLLCVCDKGEKGGYALFDIYIEELRSRNVSIEPFASRLMVSNADQALPDSEINNLYNAADIGVTTTEGEGFGLCQMEQMGVGIPQVVPDILGLNEFCTSSNSVIIPANIAYHIPIGMGALGGKAFCVDPHEYCLGIEKYLLDSSLREKHGQEAKKVVHNFVWENELKPLYEEIIA